MAVSMLPYAAILLLIVLAIILAGAILMVSRLIGTYRSGPTKASPYESGMPLVGDARRRFNVRFYMVAILFLLFDVEVVLLWPWAPVFYRAAVQGETLGPDEVGKGFLLLAAVIFSGLILIGYVYEWRKGIFRWD